MAFTEALRLLIDADTQKRRRDRPQRALRAGAKGRAPVVNAGALPRPVRATDSHPG
jgi:hypothetical protein